MERGDRERGQVYYTEYIKICWKAQRTGVHFEVGLATGSKITMEIKRLEMDNKDATIRKVER